MSIHPLSRRRSHREEIARTVSTRFAGKFRCEVAKAHVRSKPPRQLVAVHEVYATAGPTHPEQHMPVLEVADLHLAGIRQLALRRRIVKWDFRILAWRLDDLHPCQTPRLSQAFANTASLSCRRCPQPHQLPILRQQRQQIDARVPMKPAFRNRTCDADVLAGMPGQPAAFGTVEAHASFRDVRTPAAIRVSSLVTSRPPPAPVALEGERNP